MKDLLQSGAILGWQIDHLPNFSDLGDMKLTAP
jgi:hypothetical protein